MSLIDRMYLVDPEGTKKSRYDGKRPVLPSALRVWKSKSYTCSAFIVCMHDRAGDLGAEKDGEEIVQWKD